MPMPKPSKGESQDDFMSRCHSELHEEFPDDEQRTAVCFSQWRQEHGGEPPKNMKAQQWYRFRAESADVAEVLIYDEIGYSFFGERVSAKQFREDLKALGAIKILNVRINSPGGDVFDGHAIYNTLRSLRARIIVHVDGIAASAASIPVMAGDHIIMPENTMLMIHDPMAFTRGNAADMRKTAEALDKAKESIISAYRRTGQENEKLAAMMEAETWMTAAEALDLGFADEVIPAARYAANFALLGKYRHVPDLKGLASRGQPPARKAPEPKECTRSYEDARRLIVNRRLKNERLLRP